VAVLSAEEDLSRALAAGADEAKHKTTGLDEIIASLAELAKKGDAAGADRLDT
jgi:hypothetical protein